MRIFIPPKIGIGRDFGSDSPVIFYICRPNRDELKIGVERLMRSYSFNRPLSLIFLLPLLLLLFMVGGSMALEFNLLATLIGVFTLFLLLLVLYFSLMRRMRINAEYAEWVTPFHRHRMLLEEVKHFGIVRFRKFRFVFISRLEEAPFSDLSAPVVSTEDTFLVQYRAGAWAHISDLVRRVNPELQPESFTRD